MDFPSAKKNGWAFDISYLTFLILTFLSHISYSNFDHGS